VPLTAIAGVFGRPAGGRALRRLAVPAVACLLVLHAGAGAALAAAAHETWPEVSAFVRVHRLARLYFDASYARGKESGDRALDLSGYADLSIQPILRPVLRQEDWARNRYLWARIGYTHVTKGDAGDLSPSEDRGIVSLYGKLEAPGATWLEGRARTDHRWISGDYSTRVRLRLEATREFSVLDHAATPYFNVEWFYDSRYSEWSRILYQLGSEVTVNQRFRFEVYLARQEDDVPSPFALGALGMVAKFYF
jgi:hypothetical protein